jgi:CO dehydrogenase nickel-insertion accessory protein CooC1
METKNHCSVSQLFAQLFAMEHCDVLMIPRMEFEGNGCASPQCAPTHTSGPHQA